MVKGLFTSWTGMVNEQKRLDVITNNLANASTVGYKKDGVTNQSFKNLLTYKIKDVSENYSNRQIGSMSLGVRIGEVYTDYNQGSLRSTGNTYDFAIQGSGFFNVTTTDSAGNQTVKYTRDGSFTVNQDGKLMDVSGNTLMGEGGEITIPSEAAEVRADESGNIYADGVFIDKIKLTDFTDYNYLKKQGDSFYLALDGATQLDSTATIQQGYTEQSNVNVVREMSNMIAITRAYEANQKVIQTIDGSLEQAVSSVGKV